MTFEIWLAAERARGAGAYVPADGSIELRMLRRCWDAATAAASPTDGVPADAIGTKEFRDLVRAAAPGDGWTLEGYCAAP
jgi:hypothetical protein